MTLDDEIALIRAFVSSTSRFSSLRAMIVAWGGLGAVPDDVDEAALTEAQKESFIAFARQKNDYRQFRQKHVFGRR